MRKQRRGLDRYNVLRYGWRSWNPKTKFDFLPQDVKEAAYKNLVRPILEYGSTVWGPHCYDLNIELENVQKRADRFVTRIYIYMKLVV